MITPMPLISPITYPARPVNGGPLEKSLPKSGSWFAEPKYNGWRALVHVPTRTMFNRKGELLSIAHEFKPALDCLCATLDAEAFKWIDVEALERRHGIGRGTLIVLDVVPEPDYAKTQYWERRNWLRNVLPMASVDGTIENDAVYHIPAWPSCEADMDLYHLLQQINSRLGCEFYEGLVTKKADSIYPVQTISPDREFPFWMKHRYHF